MHDYLDLHVLAVQVETSPDNKHTQFVWTHAHFFLFDEVIFCLCH